MNMRKLIKRREKKIMNSSSEAADAVIRMYLQGIEMTAKITGVGAK